MYNCVIKPGAVEPNDRNPYNTDGDFYEKMDKTADGFLLAYSAAACSKEQGASSAQLQEG